jgi:DNA-binding MurR/RpiR family transcriptional regulator
MTNNSRSASKDGPERESVVDLLRRRGPEFTLSQAAIATYILDNLTDVAYESADSLGKRLDISSATIGRFCRELGFKNFRDLREALRGDRVVSPWLTGPQFHSFVAHDPDMQWLSQAYEAETMALASVYELPTKPEWTQIVDLLATAPTVWVAGFQIQRGFALSFALQLQYLRPGVQVVDMVSGQFADALAGAPGDCIVIVDVHRYSRQSIELAAQASAAGKSLIVLTDVQNLWAHQYTKLVLNVPIRSEEIFWMSLSGLSSLSYLLLNGVVRKIGDPVLDRLEGISQLYRKFTGYSDQPLSDSLPSQPRRTSARRKERRR